MKYIKTTFVLLVCSLATLNTYAQADKQIQDILYIFDVTPDELTNYVDLTNYDLIIPYVHVQSYYDNRNDTQHPYYEFYKKWFTYLANVRGSYPKIALDMRLQNFNYVENDSVLSKLVSDLNEIDTTESNNIQDAINHVMRELISACSNSGYSINDIFGGLYVFDEPFNLDLKLMDGRYKSKISDPINPYFLTTKGKNHNKIIYDLYLNVLDSLGLSYIDTQTWGSEGVKYYTWLSPHQLTTLENLPTSGGEFVNYISFFNNKVDGINNPNANIYSPVETPYKMALDHYSFTDKNNNTVKLDNFLVFDYYNHANSDIVPYQNVVESFKIFPNIDGRRWSGNSTPTTGTTLGNINFGINKMKRLFDSSLADYTNDNLKIHYVGPIHIKHESWGQLTTLKTRNVIELRERTKELGYSGYAQYAIRNDESQSNGIIPIDSRGVYKTNKYDAAIEYSMSKSNDLNYAAVLVGFDQTRKVYFPKIKAKVNGQFVSGYNAIPAGQNITLSNGDNQVVIGDFSKGNTFNSSFIMTDNSTLPIIADGDSQDEVFVHPISDKVISLDDELIYSANQFSYSSQTLQNPVFHNFSKLTKGDFDGDGDDEIVEYNLQSSTIKVYEDIKSSQTGIQYSLTFNPSLVIVADILNVGQDQLIVLSKSIDTNNRHKITLSMLQPSLGDFNSADLSISNLRTIHEIIFDYISSTIDLNIHDGTSINYAENQIEKRHSLEGKEGIILSINYNGTSELIAFNNINTDVGIITNSTTTLTTSSNPIQSNYVKLIAGNFADKNKESLLYAYENSNGVGFKHAFISKSNVSNVSVTNNLVFTDDVFVSFFDNNQNFSSAFELYDLDKISTSYFDPTTSSSKLVAFNSLFNENENMDDILDKNFKLNPAYPNPFNPTTLISFELKNRSEVRIEVFNSSGQLVSLLTNKEYSKGMHSVQFAPTNLSSGLYFVRAVSNTATYLQKITLIK